MLIILLALIVLMLSAVIIIDAHNDAHDKARQSLDVWSDDSHFH